MTRANPLSSKTSELRWKRLLCVDIVSEVTQGMMQNLIGLIFNMENMEKTMAEMEIDINKMPLGRLSESTIKQGVNFIHCS